MTDGKKLIERCSALLNQQQLEERDGNLAICPAIIFFWGKETYIYRQHVKNMLDSSLANGDSLQYLYVSERDGSLAVENVRTGEKYSGLQEAVHAASVILLGAENSGFTDRERIFFECLLSAREEKAQQYYEAYLDMVESHSSYSAVKTLYLMIDQSDKGYEAEEQRLIDRIIEDEEKRENEIARTTYLFSNILDDGTLLLEDRIWQNYRMVADLFLLCNSVNLSGNGKGVSMASNANYLKGGIFTTAYSYMGKRIEDIAGMSVYYLMEQLFDKGNVECPHPDTDELSLLMKEKLDIESGKMELADGIFQKWLINGLPEAGALQWLPWKDYRTYKETKRGRSVDWRVLTRRTFGVWEAYYKENYEDVLKKALEDGGMESEFRIKVRKLLNERFGFFEVLHMLEGEEWKLVMQEIKPEHGKGGKLVWTEELEGKALERIGDSFIHWLRQVLEDEMISLYARTSRIKMEYQQIAADILNTVTAVGDADDQMSRFYEREVRKFISECDSILFLNTDISMEALLDGVYEIFAQMIQNRDIYRQPFEKEMAIRLEDVSEEERRDIVRKRIDGDIRNRGRLNLTMDYKNDTVKKFCMIHENSVYRNALGLNDSGSHTDVYNLNRRDCLEMVEIYKITEFDQLKLGK